METNPSYNDGSIPYGSRVVTVMRAAVNLGSYVLESVNPSRPTKILKRYDEVGGPNGSVGVPDFAEGSAIAQLATTASVQLEAGDTFATTFTAARGSETFIIHSPEAPETQDGIKKMSIKFIKKMN